MHQHLRKLLNPADLPGMFGKMLRARSATGRAREEWMSLRRELESLAYTPTDHDALVRVARRWALVALTASPEAVAGEPLPPGFTLRPDGRVQDCLATARAIEYVSWLIGAGVEPREMLIIRAHLRFGWRQFDHALADLEYAERHIPATHPDPTRLRRELRMIAKRYSAVAEEQQDATPEVRHELDGLIASTAEQIVASLDAALVPFAPRVSSAPTVTDPRFDALVRRIDRAGFAHVLWVAAPEGGPADLAEGFWTEERGILGIAARMKGDAATVTAFTQLSDGRLLETSTGRGETALGLGEWVDLLRVDAGESFDELLALHRARVAATIATEPGVRPVPLVDQIDYLRLRDLEAGSLLEHRLAHGLHESEARGYPFADPDDSVPQLQRAVWLAVNARHGQPERRAA